MDYNINSIKMIISDIDGVWTDGCVYIGNENYEMKKFNVKILGLIENMSENLDENDNVIESVRIKDEFNENILFSLPRIKRNDFYQEVKQINKLKKYFPEKLLQT